MPFQCVRTFAFILALFSVSSVTISQCLAQSTQDRFALTNFNGQITGLKTIQVVSYKNEPFTGRIAKIAFDDQFAYLATPDGLFRTSRIITPESEITFLGFANYLILNLYVHQNVLYVLKVGGDPRSNTLEAHSFLKSTDHGQTFIPLDEGLKWCLEGEFCQYMHVSQALFRNNLIFITSGGGNNFYVSNDEGKSWKVLMGFSEPASCSDVAVEIIGRKVLMGGECPLDFAYLRVGTLREDMLGWADGGFPREVMGLKELSNRNVQFIRHSPNTSFAITGVEGGLLRSNDLGETYQYKISYSPLGGGKYPYIHELLDPGRYRDLFIAGGFDKGSGLVGYLAYSFDHGDTWTDISQQINPPESPSLDVTFIREDPSGRVLVGIAKKNEHEIVLAEVLITAPLTLLTHGTQQHAVALESVNLLAGPFSPFNDFNFSSDARTRIALFATNIAPADENISAITVKAEDAQHNSHELPVEWVGRTPGYPWMTQIVVRLPDALAHVGDVNVQITVRGLASNNALLSIH
ncbi:MAG TPA: hypothetical protein VFT48_13700 [Pyrinomonadaceae bacterium]|nr:hypothetical protein [Pyrinomonadaceae bacterium]